MFRAVILDFDWTFNTSRVYYARFDEISFKVLAERFGCSTAEAERKMQEVKKKKTLSLTSAIQYMGLESDEFYDEVATRMTINSLLIEDPRLKEIILALRDMSLKVAMLTNSSRSILKKALDALKCPFEHFDLIVTSSEVEPKPSLEPFRHTVELLGCNPEESLYVGDRVSSELKPAKQVGLKTVLVGNDSHKEKSQWVDWMLPDIYHLPDLVRNLQ